MADYICPASLPGAVAALAEGPCTVLAGGTDLYAATGARALAGRVLDLAALPGLRGIAMGPGDLRIGAATTWAEIAGAAGLPPALDALRAAARTVGGVQVQAAGTIAGNLCNASPAADGVPPLLALDAAVELAGQAGIRRLPLAAFLTGARRTARAADEVMTAVLVPTAALVGRSAFAKLGARRHLVISIAMVAARIEVEDGRVARAALAVGACSPVARRLPTVEAALAGARPDAAAGRIADAAVAAALAPIGDLRASAAYRLHAAAELLRRAVREAVA